VVDTTDLTTAFAVAKQAVVHV